MIERVEIENFQSHKKSELKFVPGTNVIIGKSDAGKSAVFRAINWVTSNRPLGDSFRSEWGGDTKVTLFTTEGNTVTRIKSANKNEYIINNQSLKAFGSEVPEEVLSVLQLDSFNIQAQMDSPFLLSNTPGEAARLLNKAASIDDIDKTISGLRKSHATITRTIKYDEESFLNYSEQIKQYANLPEIEKMVKQVEELEKKRVQKVTDLDRLEELTHNIEFVQKELEESDHVPELLKKCQSAEQIYISWKSLSEKTQALKRLLSQIQQTEEKADRTEKTIISIEQEYHKLAPEICPLCGNKMKGKE